MNASRSSFKEALLCYRKQVDYNKPISTNCEGNKKKSKEIRKMKEKIFFLFPARRWPKVIPKISWRDLFFLHRKYVTQKDVSRKVSKAFRKGGKTAKRKKDQRERPFLRYQKFCNIPFDASKYPISKCFLIPL